MRSHTRGVLLAAAGTLAWSTGGIFARKIDVDTATLLSGRSIFAGLTIAGFLVVRQRKDGLRAFQTLGWPGIAMALCFAASMTGFVSAIRITTVANVLIINATGPFVTAVLAWLVLRERVRRRTLVAIVVSIIGVGIMVSGALSPGDMKGNLIATAAPLGFAAMVVIARRHPDVSATAAMSLACFVAFLLPLPWVTTEGVTARTIGLLALFGASQMGLGLILVTLGMRWLLAAEVALITVLETILSPLLTWIGVGENPGIAALIGGAFVLAAVIGHGSLDLRDQRRGVGGAIVGEGMAASSTPSGP